ncbi:50S ribosomal protein L10 [Elysia marginata]|uniref:Large ribosomal subunit protein uL10m n=1 Tax=Elysia marginata TaxID=1093978 RepID=A0AAV4I3S9_9GAST|nr:50S ribosomal protein L10 [Elysia marginata]
MTREEKSKQIQSIKDQVESSNTIYLADLSGLNSDDTIRLRRACFKANIKLELVKNTLLKKAMEASDRDFGDLHEVLKGNTSLMVCEQASAPAKIIKEFRKKSERPTLKGAYIQEAVYIGDNQLDALASMKSKEEVVGEIVMLLQSPVKNILSALDSSKDKIAGVVKTLSDKVK